MNIIGHLKTITRHRNLVMKYCCKCGIPLRGLTHDLSKYSPSEFISGAIFYANGGISPHENARKVIGCSPAWLHHKGRNKHHYEYWYDVSPKTHVYEPIPMPLEYLKESFCDRIAATKIYHGERYKPSDPLEYFKTRPMEKMMHPCTAHILESWLTMLAEQGEEKTIAYIGSIGKITCRRNFKYNTKSHT